MSKISSNEEYGGNIIRKMIDYFCHFLQVPADYSEIKSHDAAFAQTSEFHKIKQSSQVGQNPPESAAAESCHPFTAVQKLLGLVQKGAINCIIAKDFSRFGCNSIEVEYYLERVFPLYMSALCLSMTAMTALSSRATQTQSFSKLLTRE